MLVILLLLTSHIAPIVSGPRDVCQTETFNATCAPGHVIVMRSARYGRMKKMVKCLGTEYYTGCYADALELLDGRCSGRQSCLVKVVDKKLLELQPCRKDLAAYLEVDYDCRNVLGNLRICPTDGHAEIRGTYGFLSLGAQLNVGSADCPWLLSAQPGQTWTLTLYDFSRWTRQRNQDTDKCEFRLRVEEDDRSVSTWPLCESRARQSQLYVSHSHVIRVYVLQKRPSKPREFFTLEFQVTGCPNVPVPAHMTVQRNAQTASISCNVSREVWHIVCRQGSWVGQIGNCSSAVSRSRSRFHSLSNQFHFGILIAVGLGLVLGVLMGTVLLVCMMAMRRKKRRDRRELASRAAESCLLGEAETLYQLGACGKVRSLGEPHYATSGHDEAPDVIYPRRIALDCVQCDASKACRNATVINTFNTVNYERPKTSGAAASAVAPNPAECCPCDRRSEQMEIREERMDEQQL